MALTRLHTVGNYKNELKTFIGGGENFEPKLYLDSNGIATIGVGYALNKSINNIATHFAKAGIPLSATQKAALDDLLPNTNSGKVSQSDINAFNAGTNVIKLTQTQGDNLYWAVISDYEDIVKNKLGETLYNSMANTKELIALVDLAYNTGGIGTNLADAIKAGAQGDTSWRVTAWYQIRYAYNAPKKDEDGNYVYSSGTKIRSYGLQVRREKESDKFGLYSGTDGKTPINDNEAKQVLRFLEAKRSTIATYLSEVKNDALVVKGNISDLNNALNPAKTLLIADFANGISIDGQILIGQGIGNAGEEFADKTSGNDILTGTSKNDLIFGERGNDILNSGDGNDVVYGGEGKDVIDGGSGTDHLYGGENDDILYDGGDDVADYLDGGAGNDKYIVKNGDHIHDDATGLGEVYFEGIRLTGGTAIAGKSDEYKGDGGTYTLVGDLLIFTDKTGKQVSITGYKNGQLGINLTGDDLELTIIGHTANENDGVITGKVYLTQAYSEDIIVHLSTLDDSAHAGEDYVAKNDITVTIKKGQLEGEFSVNLLDNLITEGRENFFTQIDSVTDTSNTPITYTIKDITPPYHRRRR